MRLQKSINETLFPALEGRDSLIEYENYSASVKTLLYLCVAKEFISTRALRMEWWTSSDRRHDYFSEVACWRFGF
jgi:hypothetical protein